MDIQELGTLIARESITAVGTLANTDPDNPQANTTSQSKYYPLFVILIIICAVFWLMRKNR